MLTICHNKCFVCISLLILIINLESEGYCVPHFDIEETEV